MFEDDLHAVFVFQAAGDHIELQHTDGAEPGAHADQRPRRAQAIDEGRHPSIAGTLAGDNTIFVAAKDGTTAHELWAELAAYLADGGTG